MSFYITDSDGNGHYTDFTFSAPSNGLVNKHVLNIISTHNGNPLSADDIEGVHSEIAEKLIGLVLTQDTQSPFRFIANIAGNGATVRTGADTYKQKPSGKTVIFRVLQDSIGTVTVYLSSDGNEGIYNNVYYTLIGSNIVNEVSLQRSQALGIINNVGKYENIIKECDNILAMFENKEPTNGSQFNEEFASFRKDVVSVLQSQQQAINLMMDSLGLNKLKENPDGK